MNNGQGTAVLCSCCGQEVMAHIHPGEGLEVIDHRHGTAHMALVPSRELLERLAGTSGEGILAFVRGLL